MPVLPIYIPLDTPALAISHSYYHADRKNVMLGYNKNYTILALNYTLKDSRGQY